MKARAAAVALIGGIAVTLAGVAPAVAETSISAASAPVVATFGEPWMLELEVSAVLDSFIPPVTESSGSVDVFIEQVPGTFLENLTVQSNGRVFVTQPPGQPWLAPGTYDVRAVFSPSASTGLQTAEFRMPGAITINPLELTANITVNTDAAAAIPTITVALAGAGEDVRDSLPPGVWNLSIREASGSDVLFSRQVLQTAALDPLVVEMGEELRPDVDHVLVAEFVPVAEYAAGVVVNGAGDIPFRTAPQDLGQLLVTPVDLPIWALVIALVGLLAGIAGLVTALVVRARRAPRAVTVGVAHDPVIDADVVELADINDLFDEPAPVGAEAGDDTAPHRDNAGPDETRDLQA